jgi:RNA-directed DNA polymerase
MSISLNLPQDYLLKVARKASHCYKTYFVPKRTGGQRTIHHPSKELKALQRWLLYNIIEDLPVHEAAMAYRHRVSIKDNALRHVKSRYLLRLDFKDFFPSLSAVDVANYINSQKFLFPGWDAVDTTFFISIVCREGKLTIGAPTSPSLSNALCFDLDSELDAISKSHDVLYTRYADDLFFSAKRPNILTSFPVKVEEVSKSLKIPKGLSINVSKTRHSSKRGCRRVTGIILGSDGKISVGRAYKRYIRHQIYHYDLLSGPEKVKLAGSIAQAQSVDPDMINSLVSKYGIDLVEKARRGT